MRNFLSRRLWKPRQPLDQEEMVKMEEIMQESLVPITPRPAFISALKERILSAPEPKVPSMAPALQYTLLGFIGLFSSLLIIVTGIRATITLLGALGIISQMRKRSAPA